MNHILKQLNERRNKLVLQQAHHLRIEGFDLAIDIVRECYSPIPSSSISKDNDVTGSSKASEPVVSLPAPVGNSIEQDAHLLIYTTVADAEDIIRFSAIFDRANGTYGMPSLCVFNDGKESLYADSEAWLAETLLAAIKRFEAREMINGDKEAIDEVIKHCPSIADQLYTVTAIRQILQYAVSARMLKNVMNAQVRDASKADSSNTAGSTKETPSKESEAVERLPVDCKDKKRSKNGPCKYPIGSCQQCRSNH